VKPLGVDHRFGAHAFEINSRIVSLDTGALPFPYS
jgi:hypothetical protein